MLFYYNEQKDKNGYIYSVDMVRLTFNMPSTPEKQKELVKYFANDNRSDITVYPPCFKSMKYKNLVNIDYGPSTVTIGFGFNGPCASDYLKGFIEFNPNKIMNGNKKAFKYDFDVLTCYCNSFDIARYDLAIDVPIARENIRLENPSGKVYGLKRYSETNKTETLGVRNSNGYLKIYNKAIEAEITQDGEKLEKLTRIELTVGTDSLTEIINNIPPIYERCTMENSGLSSTQSVLVDLIRESKEPEKHLNNLEYRIRKKIEPFIAGDNKRLKFDALCIAQVHANANIWASTSITVLPIKVNDEWIKVDHTPFDNM